jgi:hypothetical protein
MAMTSITRRNPLTGRIERPWLSRESVFVLADPAYGAQKHHDRFAVKVESLDEVLALVRKGFSLRMTDGESPPSLISPDSLTIEEVEAGVEGQLWFTTLPKPPFSKEATFEELKTILFVQASQIAHAGRPEFATEFLGFEPQALRPPYDSADLRRLDLSRFSATEYVDRAYDYALQKGEPRAFGGAMAQNAIQFLEGANPSDENGEPSPIMSPGSKCRVVIEMALARWHLANGFPITVRQMALLANMKEPAVRNSLSKERIAVENKTVTDEVALAWLMQRRNFVPTREEQPRTGK